MAIILASHYHILGTDKVGRDVFYLTLKSVRTGLVIGTLTTLFALPFALLLGTIAGYFRGWIDDIIQYLYITLSSIPGFTDFCGGVEVAGLHGQSCRRVSTLAQRADVRLLALCFILGITGWADLCRFFRGETLKVRELEFVQAAKTLGVSQMLLFYDILSPMCFILLLSRWY